MTGCAELIFISITGLVLLGGQAASPEVLILSRYAGEPAPVRRAKGKFTFPAAVFPLTHKKDHYAFQTGGLTYHELA